MSTEDKIKELPSSNGSVKSIQFGIPLPPSVLQEGSLNSGRTSNRVQNDAMLMVGDAGIVGSITLLSNSAMVWIGWGRMDTTSEAKSNNAVPSGVPVMGQLVAAFPRTKFQGAFSSAGEASCSQLVGGNSEDQMLGHQMASRLSQKLEYPVLISCGLFSGAGAPEWMAGLDRAPITQRAAALAERHVRMLLKEQLN